MPSLTLKSVALGWLLSAACVVVDCSSKTEPAAGAGGASQGGLGSSDAGSQNDAESGGEGGAPSSAAGDGNAAGASGAVERAGAAGASAGAGGEGDAVGGARDAGPDTADAADDAALMDAQSGAQADASEGGAAGSGEGSTAGGAASQDAGIPPPDCGTDDEPPAASDAGVATREQVQAILSGRCVFCHSEPSAPMGLVLTDVAAVVGTRSTECSSKLRIQAGSAKDSYLVDKLRGASQTPCGCYVGQRMPLDDDPVPDAELASIVSWINAGAH